MPNPNKPKYVQSTVAANTASMLHKLLAELDWQDKNKPTKDSQDYMATLRKEARKTHDEFMKEWK